MTIYKKYKLIVNNLNLQCVAQPSIMASLKYFSSTTQQPCLNFHFRSTISQQTHHLVNNSAIPKFNCFLRSRALINCHTWFNNLATPLRPLFTLPENHQAKSGKEKCTLTTHFITYFVMLFNTALQYLTRMINTLNQPNQTNKLCSINLIVTFIKLMLNISFKLVMKPNYPKISGKTYFILYFVMPSNHVLQVITNIKSSLNHFKHGTLRFVALFSELLSNFTLPNLITKPTPNKIWSLQQYLNPYSLPIYKKHLTMRPLNNISITAISVSRSIKIFISITSFIIIHTLLIRSGDVELNPGPPLNFNINFNDFKDKESNYTIISQNCSGMLNADKQKLLLNKLLKIKKSRLIVGLQETHFTHKHVFSFNARWGHQAIHSTFNNSSRGSSILYKTSDWDQILETFSDPDGRLSILTVKLNTTTSTFVNCYCPNNQNEQINFLNTIKLEMDRIITTFNDTIAW